MATRASSLQPNMEQPSQRVPGHEGDVLRNAKLGPPGPALTRLRLGQAQSMGPAGLAGPRAPCGPHGPVHRKPLFALSRPALPRHVSAPAAPPPLIAARWLAAAQRLLY